MGLHETRNAVALPAGRHSAVVLLPFVILILLGMAGLVEFDSGDFTPSASLPSLAVCLVLGTLLQMYLINANGSLNFDLKKPDCVYGFFYFCYYVVPTILLCVGIAPMVENQFEISMMLLIGYLLFLAGVAIGGYDIRGRKIKEHPGSTSAGISKPQWIALMITTVICAGIVAVATLKSIQNGMFFTHAVSGTKFLMPHQDKLINVISASLEFPVILMLGLAMSIKDHLLSRLASVTLYGYITAATSLWVLSSQFRPAFTGIILFLIAMKLGGKTQLHIRHLLAAILMGILFFGTIRAVRQVNVGNMRGSTNQLADSVDLTQKVIGSNPFTHLISVDTGKRAAGSLYLLSGIMTSADLGYDFVYGEMFVDSLYALVPRAIWNDKPAFEPFQSQMRRHFGLRIHDDPASPIIYFYANAGWLGILGYMVFGFLSKRFALFAGDYSRVGPWIFFIFVWSGAVQLEQEVILLTLQSLRSAICIYLIYKGSLMIVQRTKQSAGRPRQSFKRHAFPA